MSSSDHVLRRLEAELAELERRAQCRQLDLTRGINLCSNDYLGFATDPRVKAALLEELSCTTRIAATGSRLLSGNARIWEEVEGELAVFTGAEAALYFGSGYAANLGLLSALLRPGDTVFSDRLNHASLIDGIRLSRARRVIVPHLDLNFLEDALRRTEGEAGDSFIVVESVFSMEGDRAPLCHLAILAERYGASLIVDEAHATGVFGPQGRGLAALAARSAPLLATVHTCGKALAASGAFVACSETLKRYLINRARTFIFSTALPRYMAAQVRATVRLGREADPERERLVELGAELRGRLRAAGFDLGSSDTQIVPVILGANELALSFARELALAGFTIKAIRPPTVPPGMARLRISLNAILPMDSVARLANSMIAIRDRTAALQPCCQP